MSMGLNPIFNLIVNKFSLTKIVDCSSFDDYFQLCPDKDQFGYTTLLGLKSNLEYKHTLCFLLILALEFEQFKIPFNRIRQLRQIICSFLNLNPLQVANKEYLTRECAKLKLSQQHQSVSQSEKMKTQQETQLNHPPKQITNTQVPLKKQSNPFGDFSTFMTREKKEIQQEKKILFIQEKFKIPAIQEEKRILIIIEKPFTFAINQTKEIKPENQSKSTQKQLFPSSPLFQPQKVEVNNQPTPTKVFCDIRDIYSQPFVMQFSNRHSLECNIPRKRPTKVSSERRNHIFYNLMKFAEELERKEKNKTEEIMQPHQLKQVEEKVTIISNTSGQFLIKEEEQIKEITTKEQIEENLQPHQLNQVEEKITDINETSDQFLIKEEKQVMIKEITIEDVTQQSLQIEKKEQQIEQKEISCQGKDKVTADQKNIIMTQQLQQDEQLHSENNSSQQENSAPKDSDQNELYKLNQLEENEQQNNQNSQKNIIIKEFIKMNRPFKLINQQNRIKTLLIPYQRKFNLQYQITIPKNNSGLTQIHSRKNFSYHFLSVTQPKVNNPKIKFFYLIRINFKMKILDNQIDKEIYYLDQMSTLFIHPITGVYHFHQCSFLCFSKSQIEGVKQYMEILSFFHFTRKRPELLGSTAFQGCIRSRLEKLQSLKRIIGLKKLKRRTLSKKIMEVLIQEDEVYVINNQAIVNCFLDNQFTEFTKDLKKITNFRRTNN